jgi:hypothetical protein
MAPHMVMRLKRCAEVDVLALELAVVVPLAAMATLRKTPSMKSIIQR